MRRWLAAIPIAVLAIIGVVTALQLAQPEKPGFALSTLRAAPAVSFDRFKADGQLSFTSRSDDQLILVNLFASWCAPCRAEHKYIASLAEAYPEQVFGLAYKDRPEDTAAFLNELGNPYTDIGTDPDGQGGLDFGLTGVPESFLIDAEGMIVYHLRGPLNEALTEEIAVALGG